MRIWRPHTTGILIGGLALILVASVASYVAVNFQPTIEVRLGSGVFTVRTATTDDAREKGLSKTAKLAPNNGLLLVFDEDAEWGIWMKDMKYPIDIIWLDSGKRVVHMVIDASPDVTPEKTFTPVSPARYVLEVPSGTIKSSAIKIGSQAEFTLGGQR
jgi:uncharacterized membrane protein (UPF0127 family)